MKRKEFIDTLSTLLKEELPSSVVDENIRYYNDYLIQQGDEIRQEQEIQRIGEPNIIAQTIIESYKMSDAYKYNSQFRQKSYGESYQEPETKSKELTKDAAIWGRVKGFLMTAATVVVVVALIRFAFSLFIRIGLPIIVIYLVIRFIKEIMGNN